MSDPQTYHANHFVFSVTLTHNLYDYTIIIWTDYIEVQIQRGLTFHYEHFGIIELAFEYLKARHPDSRNHA